ncbi:MAG TPA: hypothetical protein P5556_01055 [Candidatus Gastranaerophilales bacterium]|nr:hypothetical protein [Candidatus Gastranaerophilales bacterium]
MILNIKKPFFILFNKDSLFNLLIFSIISILNTYSFFLPTFMNVVIMGILFFTTIALLFGYIVETVHISIKNCEEKINLPSWKLNILTYLKHSFSLIVILIIYQLIITLITYVISVPFENLDKIIFSLIFPLIIIMYAKNFKILEALNCNLYLQLIKNNFKKFLIISILSTLFFMIVFIAIDAIKASFIGSGVDSLYFYIFNYILYISSFLVVLFYSQLFKPEREEVKCL